MVLDKIAEGNESFVYSCSIFSIGICFMGVLFGIYNIIPYCMSYFKTNRDFTANIGVRSSFCVDIGKCHNNVKLSPRVDSVSSDS